MYWSRGTSASSAQLLPITTGRVQAALVRPAVTGYWSGLRAGRRVLVFSPPVLVVGPANRGTSASRVQLLPITAGRVQAALVRPAVTGVWYSAGGATTLDHYIFMQVVQRRRFFKVYSRRWFGNAAKHIFSQVFSRRWHRDAGL